MPFNSVNTRTFGCRISYFFQTALSSKEDLHIRTGTFMGYEVFLWNCEKSKRIVVYRWDRICRLWISIHTTKT
ncbi:hypothetical protein BWD12_11115 [Leptospira santarosai serovar Bananal]|nr:hypothetical protein BV917_14460 [Leptospira santarosai serovar Guaricura]OLY63258.1 hypothetical protein BWD11_15700 [Leptospira santarosai serovar Grippotyphosa]ONF78821.1 hypothetical protein BWD12_11115 [Leptospira santarosai serovar Bananal]